MRESKSFSAAANRAEEDTVYSATLYALRAEPKGYSTPLMKHGQEISFPRPSALRSRVHPGLSLVLGHPHSRRLVHYRCPKRGAVWAGLGPPRGTLKTGQGGTSENRPTELKQDIDSGGGILHRREQCLERREATASNRAGAAGMAVEAHPRGNRDSPGNGRHLPESGRHRGQASPWLGPSSTGANDRREVRRLRAGFKTGQRGVPRLRR